MASEDNSWRTQAFRQSVVSKIDEAIQRSGMSTSRNSVDMENHVFQKAKTREEYLGLVARLILHVREINTKKMQGPGGGAPGAGGAGGGMQDPINALQNLASQGSRNAQLMGGPQSMPPIAAPNLLQTLNRPNAMMQGVGVQPGGMQGQMAGQMQGQVAPGQIQLQQLQVNNQGPNVQPGPGQLQGQMQSQLGGPLQAQLQNQLQGQMQSQMQGQMQGQMPVQMQGQMQSQMQGQLQMTQMQANAGQMAHMQARKPNDGMLGMSGAPGTPFGPRNPTPTQFLTQSPTQGVASPASHGAGSSNTMVASPALVPSPGSGLGPRAPSLAASPSSSSLNTPAGPTNAQPSPLPLHEEQAYRDKVRQLSKYIEPLRKMIARMGNDDVEKLSKMKKLLEILSNPSQRMPLETLIKCEVVLEKLDLKRGEGGAGAALPLKEHHAFSPLLEAVGAHLASPLANHTMHRTFGPALEALFGPEIKLPPPLKKRRLSSATGERECVICWDSDVNHTCVPCGHLCLCSKCAQECEISGVLQGEIARLDQRFKITMSALKSAGSRCVHLSCHLDDRQLPCVPPVSLSVPEDYPASAPACVVSSHDYDSTQFLQAVKRALLARIAALPRRFSVSQLLNTWEMSIRQAAAPKQRDVQHNTTTLLMGL